MLSMEVKSVRKFNGYWEVIASEPDALTEHKFRTCKLIVASGCTSIPKMPSLSGKEEFAGQILHQDGFGSSHVLTLPNVKAITVLGAGKSSADMVYEAVKAGKVVSWVIKETNTTGPGFFLSPKGVGPYKNAFEIGMTRIAATFTPSFMNWLNWWTKLLHSDFYDAIAENVRIYEGDVDCLKEGNLLLKSGINIPTDALLCGTGWHPSLQFFSEEQCRELGLPHLSSQESIHENTRWIDLEAEADAKVLATFPQLADPPSHYHKPTFHTPYRLYRHIVSLSESGRSSEDRSIAFIGQIGVGKYFPSVECQSMWATAYLDGKLSLPNAAEQEKDVALFTTWCKRRYLSNGEEGNNMTFELIGYCDTLLNDLGLSSHRKGLFKDLFAPTWAKDLSGLKREFIERYDYGT